MSRPSWKYKLFLLALYSLAYAFFYVLPNFYPLYEPVFLPMFALDRAIPFVPWTFLVYVSDYFLFAVVVTALVDLEEFNAYARTCFIGIVLCGLFFFAFPTIYPRPPYPELEPGLISFIMGLVATGDMPTNCFPSMHVTMTAIATLALRNHSKWLFGLVSIWAFAVFASTLTTKQHYLLDIIGGFGVTAVTFALDWWLVRRVSLFRSPQPELHQRPNTFSS